MRRQSPVLLTFSLGVPLTSWLTMSLNFSQPAWFGGVRLFAADRAPLVCFLLPLVVGTVAVLAMPRLRTLTAVSPPAWLVCWQLGRMIGGLFLIAWAYDQLPGAFAWPAGIGGLLLGVMALLVALGCARWGRAFFTVAVLWNVLGLLDFVVAITTAARSETRLAFPLILIPGYLVPLTILVHVYSLCNLASWRESGEN